MSIVTDTANGDIDTAALTAILDTASVLDSVLTAFGNQPCFSGSAAATWLAELADELQADIRAAEILLMEREHDANSVSRLAGAGGAYLEPTDVDSIHAVLRQAYYR